MNLPPQRRARTTVLDIAYEHHGPATAYPVVLVHGFPYDPRAFDAVVPLLTAAGHSVVVPYVRGYGETRFLSPDTPRSGQQAAIAHDLLELLDALDIRDAVLAGFDWGARAACIVAALWPGRVRGLVSCSGYHVQDIAGSIRPGDPEDERRYWYQYYFHTERGRNGLAERRDALCSYLWKLWSPTCKFDAAAFVRTARSFTNPDFVDVCIHSYRHRHGNAAGDPRYADIESRLARLPTIGVPTIAVHGGDDDVLTPAGSAGHAKYFTGPYERRVLAGVGHNPPHEAPAAFAAAILDVLRLTTEGNR
jgi:pimeloyl-ACP methyl ester carboxylesterase